MRRSPGDPYPPCKEDGCDRPTRTRGWCASHYNRAYVNGSPHAADLPSSAENRFAKMTKWGEPSSHRPDLGPCLIYLGADNGNGYGQFTWGGKRTGYAHRYAWEREHGAIPDGLTVDHLCRVRNCANAAHMELVDGPENTRRAARIRTHCAKNHEYTPDNLKYRNGRRCCKTCLDATAKRGAERRTNAYRGLQNKRIKYDQVVVRAVIAEIRSAESTIAIGSRRIGCSPGYLGRRVWEETKADVITRDGSCIACGRSHGVILDAHHRIARGQGGASRPEIAFGMANLVTLCRDDHEETEANPDAARKVGLRVDRGQFPADVPVLRRNVWVQLRDDGSVIPHTQTLRAL